MNDGDEVLVKNAKGEQSRAILVGSVYVKDWAKHYGNREPILMSMVKVRRFINSKGCFAKTATEYPFGSVVK